MTPTTAPDPRSLEGTLRAWALGYPGVTEEFPWGERAFKVSGKVFLFLRAAGGTVSFSLKLPQSAAEALELPDVEPTGYGLGKAGWVTARVNAGRDTPVDTFRAWIDESFRAVAPKRVVAALGGAATMPNTETNDMKGGKAGRDRKSGGGSAGKGGARGGPPAKKGAVAKRPTDAPPKKGSRKKPGFGGSSSAGEE